VLFACQNEPFTRKHRIAPPYGTRQTESLMIVFAAQPSPLIFAALKKVPILPIRLIHAE
jgi:hypothetical protein